MMNLSDIERVRHHYAVERVLADRLRHSTRVERLRLYRDLYDELFRQVPEHPLMQADVAKRERVVASQLAFLRPLVGPSEVFLEIGAGDCRLSTAMAAHVRQVYALDVSAELAAGADLPANCCLVISDGCTVPVPPGSVSLAFSDQLMEHLHPADAVEQLREIYRALAPDGIYLLFTPNRLSGPHDVSKYFDEVATGFHLKEYTTAELADVLRAAGFRRVSVPFRGPRGVMLVPSHAICALERLVERGPRPVSRAVARHLPFKKLLGRVAAVK
jgi:SAM-dependent methyltransferase